MTLDELETLREGWSFEVKRAGGRDGRGALPVTFWETYSAFANTHGGRVVLGVRERDDRSLEVTGIREPQRVVDDLWNLLQNPQKVSANLLCQDDVRVEEVEGQSIVVVDVPRAPREQRPVYLNGDLFGGTYLRVGEGDRKADKVRVQRLVADAEYAVRDDKVLPRMSVADLDPDTVKAYRNVFRSNHPDHPWLRLDDSEFLRQLGAVRRDRESQAEGLTLAGLLLLGRFNAICEALPNFFLDYQEHSDQEEQRWVDRIYPDGTWSGNLFDFYSRTINKLTLDLRVPFQLGEDLFRRDETHVHEAVREALVNTVIHADYEGRTGVRVVKRRAGFEFRNPGTLRLPIEQVRRGGISDCRNQTLQRMFLHLRLGELAGSGFGKIQRAWREQSWRAPELVDDVELDTTTLRLTTASLLPQTVLDILDKRFSVRFRGLDEVARLALATAEIEGEVSNRRLQEISDKHPRDLTYLLRDLVGQGFLLSHGQTTGTYYTVAQGASLAAGGEDVTEVPPQADELHTQASELHTQGGELHTQDDELPPQGDELPPQGGSVVDRVAASRRAPPDQVRQAVLAYCRGRFRSMPEIAQALNRAPRSLQARYLRELVRSGELLPKHPAAPNHPQQAYRTREDDPCASPPSEESS